MTLKFGMRGSEMQLASPLNIKSLVENAESARFTWFRPSAPDLDGFTLRL